MHQEPSNKCAHSIFHSSCDGCKTLQSYWYQRLEESDYEDIEDHSGQGLDNELPLKKWGGFSTNIYSSNGDLIDLIDHVVSQPEASPIQSSFPLALFRMEEQLLHTPEFEEVCHAVSVHRNNSLDAKKIGQIWESYCDGMSIRELASVYDTHRSSVMRAIDKIKGWMDIVNLELEEEKPSVVLLRPFQPATDSGLLYSTWRNALWFSEPRSKDHQDSFYSKTTHFIRQLLSQKSTKVLVACLEENPDFIIGYSVMDASHLYWIYVKIDYRGKKIGKLLTRGMLTYAEPMTRIGKAITQRREHKESEDGKEDASQRIQGDQKSS